MSVVRNDADYYLIISSILFFIFFGCRYENLLRVTEASEEVEEGHLVAGGAVARLGAQYSADDYQVIKRIRSTAAAEANRQQRKTDPRQFPYKMLLAHLSALAQHSFQRSRGWQ